MSNSKRHFPALKAILSRLLMKTSFLLSDEAYLKALFRLKMGYKLDLKHPKTYSEKLMWLKLNDHKPEYTTLVDKCAVKKHVADLIGEQYVIPTIGVWESPEEIEWDKLPNQFVLKTTHGGGNTGVVICKDMATFDKEEAIAKLSESLKQDIYRTLREWPYKNVPRRILAEQYIEAENNDLPDYKFFCFDGEVKALFIGTERGTGNVKFDYFDADFNHLDLIQTHPMSGKQFEKPACFEEMKEVASKLSQGIPHVRIDLYEVKGKIYFGEYTFYHHGGCVPFHPQKWDDIFGAWIHLPEKV
jgi:hypothetical protein